MLISCAAHRTTMADRRSHPDVQRHIAARRRRRSRQIISLIQLSAAAVLGRDWFGTLPVFGPVLYLHAEEDADEINRRLEAIAQHYSSSRRELIDQGLRILSFAGRDAILGEPDHHGIIRPTPLFEQIKRDAMALRPKLIVIDTVADVFAGKEIDRAETRHSSL